ncbi:MAG: lytic transglycosylase domain-containing protein [Saprospiraceae bacterium]|nr:lytic transglycosylase domain-containing protein [Saprospiraceae bacterium]
MNISLKTGLALLALPLVLGLILLFQSFDDGAPKDTIAYTAISFDPSKEYILAGESFDLNHFDVRERLEREILVNAHWESSTTLNMKRAARFFPIIESILKENEVPDDFKYLAVAESNLEMKASPAGARGLWQFMKGTGIEFGLEIDEQVDERLHLQKSTEAFCKKIKKDKAKFGSWMTTMAAYNMGRGGIIKVIDSQGSSNFFEMNLNEETMRYPFRVMAIKEIFEHPSEYGFIIGEDNKYAPFERRSRSIEIRESIKSLSSFARSNDMTYRELKVLNPWLRDHKLIVRTGKSYQLKVFK